MKKVWIINLKDNRNNGDKLNSDVKFNLCFANNVIGIGWVDENLNSSISNDSNYKRALNSLNEISKDDLVWVRNPMNKIYYICEVIGNCKNLTELKSHFEENDISNIENCKEVRFYEVGCKEKLPSPITYRNLISVSTVRRIKNNQAITDATFDWFNSYINKYGRKP